MTGSSASSPIDLPANVTASAVGFRRFAMTNSRTRGFAFVPRVPPDFFAALSASNPVSFNRAEATGHRHVGVVREQSRICFRKRVPHEEQHAFVENSSVQRGGPVPPSIASFSLPMASDCDYAIPCSSAVLSHRATILVLRLHDKVRNR